MTPSSPGQFVADTTQELQHVIKEYMEKMLYNLVTLISKITQ